VPAFVTSSSPASSRIIVQDCLLQSGLTVNQNRTLKLKKTRWHNHRRCVSQRSKGARIRFRRSRGKKVFRGEKGGVIFFRRFSGFARIGTGFQSVSAWKGWRGRTIQEPLFFLIKKDVWIGEGSKQPSLAETYNGHPHFNPPYSNPQFFHSLKIC